MQFKLIWRNNQMANERKSLKWHLIVSIVTDLHGVILVLRPLTCIVPGPCTIVSVVVISRQLSRNIIFVSFPVHKLLVMVSVTGTFRAFPTFKIFFMFNISWRVNICTAEAQVPACFALSQMSVFVIIFVLCQPSAFRFWCAPIWGGYASPQRALPPPFSGHGVFTVLPPRWITVLSTSACPLQTSTVCRMGIPLSFLLFPVLIVAVPVPSLSVLPAVIGPVGIHLSPCGC